jgi:hypothetical protein
VRLLSVIYGISFSAPCWLRTPRVDWLAGEENVVPRDLRINGASKQHRCALENNRPAQGDADSVGAGHVWRFCARQR